VRALVLVDGLVRLVRLLTHQDLLAVLVHPEPLLPSPCRRRSGPTRGVPADRGLNPDPDAAQQHSEGSQDQFVGEVVGRQRADSHPSTPWQHQPGENPCMAAFFLPRASDSEQAERLYDALAEFAGCEPAPRGQRVQSIAFAQDGAQWVAEVGKELSGQRTTQQLRRGELVERTETLASTSRVLAVYPGTPFVVVTDAQPITGTPSEWANPFLAQPDQVTYFDAQ
jgi:hypothetical protein